MSTRTQFLTEIERDFTYQAKITDGQREHLAFVKTTFQTARSALETEIQAVCRGGPMAVDEHFHEGMRVLRKAERRANAAIALDTKPEVTYIHEESPVSETHPEEPVRSTRQAHYHRVTAIFYQLVVKVATLIPMGRRAALFRTYLEDARGEYLDGVNVFHDAIAEHSR